MTRKKLIEVALSLDAIDKASTREVDPPREPLDAAPMVSTAAAGAVILAQMIDDPSANPDLFPTEKKQEKERQRLFEIIENLLQREDPTNEEVAEAVRAETWRIWRRLRRAARPRGSGGVSETVDVESGRVYVSRCICPPPDTPKGLGRGYFLEGK